MADVRLVGEGDNWSVWAVGAKPRSGSRAWVGRSDTYSEGREVYLVTIDRNRTLLPDPNEAVWFWWPGTGDQQAAGRAVDVHRTFAIQREG